METDRLIYVSPSAETLEYNAVSALRLLAPFDPVVWDRRRFEHLW